MRRNYELYIQWLRRDISLRYAGSLLGPLWLIVQPILYILVFTIVFHRFFNMRWPVGDGSMTDYGLQVFVGLAIHTCCAEILNRTPAVIQSHPYLVTKVKFPLAVLPMVTVGTAFIQLSISLLMIAPWVLVRGFGFYVLFLPVAIIPIFILCVGMGWFLSALGVYLRDVASFMPSITSFLMFLTPIFYPADIVPAAFAWMIELNPLAWAIESVRGLIFEGQDIAWAAWIGHAAFALLFSMAALAFFRRVQPGFADVL